MAFITLVLGALCHFGHTKIAWGILIAMIVFVAFVLYELGPNLVRAPRSGAPIGVPHGCEGTLAGCCADGTTQAKSPIDPCKN